MSKKRSNANKAFMVFNAVLFIAVVAICFIFLYLAYSMKRSADRKEAHEGQYRIELTTDFAGKSLSIYINDSLLANRIMPDSTIQLDINRFAEDHVLMVVDNLTDNVTSFNLSKEGSKITVRQSEGELIIEETPGTFQ